LSIEAFARPFSPSGRFRPDDGKTEDERITPFLFWRPDVPRQD
jgi:hypothetical protein